MLDSEELRVKYPKLRVRVDDFLAINGRKPNAREMLEMALWDEKADKEDLVPKMVRKHEQQQCELLLEFIAVLPCPSSCHTHERDSPRCAPLLRASLMPM
jgi:hypothetical protein